MTTYESFFRTLVLAIVMSLCAARTMAQINTDNCYFHIEPAIADMSVDDYDTGYGYKSTIQLINPADRYVTAYQFDLTVAAGLDVRAITLNKARYPYSENLGEKTYYHRLAYGKVLESADGSSVWRVLCYSLESPATGNNRLSNTTADILDIYCQATSPGIYQLKIERIPTLENSTVEVNACDDLGNMEYLKTWGSSSNIDIVTSITPIISKQDTLRAIYNIRGTRVTRTIPHHIYVIDGKKLIDEGD